MVVPYHQAMPSYARHREMYALSFPPASALLLAIPTGHGDGMMNLRARCAETVVPSACPDIHSKLVITSICMSAFQDTGGVILDHLQMGKLRYGVTGLCMRENGVSQPLGQTQDTYQEWGRALKS